MNPTDLVDRSSYPTRLTPAEAAAAILRRRFERKGYEIAEAESGRECLAAIAKEVAAAEEAWLEAEEAMAEAS